MELQQAFEAAVTFKDVLPVVLAGGFATGMFGLLTYIDYRIKEIKHKEFLALRGQLKTIGAKRDLSRGKVLHAPVK